MYELKALTWHHLQLTGVMEYEKMAPLHGSAVILLLMAAILQAAGAMVMRQWKLLHYGLLAPFYWILFGIAVWRSLWQLCVSPFSWDKNDAWMKGIYSANLFASCCSSTISY